MSQLKKGVLISYVNILLTNVVGLLLTPYIVRSLGNSEYGLYTLIGSVVAYLSLMDLGLNHTIMRFVARYRAVNDTEGEKEFLGTTMLIFIAIAILVVLIGLWIYFNLESIFSKSLTVEELVKAKVMFLILIFNVAINIPGSSFQAICNAYEHFVFPRVVAIVKYLLRAAMVCGLLFMGGKAITLVMIDTVFNILVILVTAFYVFYKLKVTVSLARYNTSLISEIFGYSFWVFLFAIVSKFQWNSGQVILGINNNTLTVAIFGVGIMLGGYYGAFADAVNGVLIPKATQMVYSGKKGGELTDTMIKIARMNGFLMFFILSGFFLFGKTFVFLWLGKDYLESWLIALLIMIVLTVPLLQVFGNCILEAKRKNRFKSVLSICLVSIAAGISFFITKQYGIYGAILPLVFTVSLNNLIMNLYYKKIFEFEIGKFFKNAIMKSLIVYGIVSLALAYLLSLFQISTWLMLFLVIAAYAVIYLLITFFLLMNKSEKELILSRIR
ncbi:oligosaccharide flippase family protein [Flavobacterium sp. SUN046]|uniref:oligosaccharide flippase family protein n=1 Tax=Flavobacterium sp. SUN046 TaxID=3002440 RepID=UPI002DBBBEAD|nr:oligosaccharide flippase family protein [Flavobacterium sp. SUN046]MEC4050879.1 oligosaccharide flippase family protein [Flavobacterium sp. SUN046]